MEHATAENENGAKKIAKIFITAGLILIAVVVIAAAIVIGFTGKGKGPSDNESPVVQGNSNGAEDMTPPPVRSCPNVGMVPPAPASPRASRVAPPPAKPAVYAAEEESITLGSADYGRVRLIAPPPKDGSYTPFVRVPVTAGYGLDAYGPPADSEWIEDKRGVDSEGFAWIRWANKPGAVPVTEIQLRLR